MKIIWSPMDFLGLNIYSATYVRAADIAQGYAMVPEPPVVSAHVLALAVRRAGGHVLGCRSWWPNCGE